MGRRMSKRDEAIAERKARKAARKANAIVRPKGNTVMSQAELRAMLRMNPGSRAAKAQTSFDKKLKSMTVSYY